MERAFDRELLRAACCMKRVACCMLHVRAQHATRNTPPHRRFSRCWATTITPAPAATITAASAIHSMALFATIGRSSAAMRSGDTCSAAAARSSVGVGVAVGVGLGVSVGVMEGVDVGDGVEGNGEGSSGESIVGCSAAFPASCADTSAGVRATIHKASSAAPANLLNLPMYVDGIMASEVRLSLFSCASLRRAPRRFRRRRSMSEMQR